MSESRRLKTVRLLVPSNKAKPSPQIGQALGQLGINMMKFCKEFNGLTTQYIDDIPLRVKLYSYADGTYNFTIHPPQTSWLIKRAAGISKGSSTPGSSIVGTIHAKQLYEIAKVKQQFDSNAYMSDVTLLAIVRQMVGQCKSMGINVDVSRMDRK